MASRKRGARRRSGAGAGAAGGIKGFLAAGAMILIIAASAVGWWNYNGFKNVGDALNWFQTKSANMNNCVEGELTQEGPDAQNIVNAHGCIIPNVVGTSPTGGSISVNLTPESKQATLTSLDELKVAAAEDVDYSRSEWKHWLDLDGDGCDTREQILIANGTGVESDPKTCKILSGSWVENYASKTFEDSSAMDLDHVVPLSWAAANGGNEWSVEQKTAFANDPGNLLLSDASENRSKGDKGPSEYLPPNEDFQCIYVNTFVSTVAKYELTIPQLDKSAAEKAIQESC